MKLLQYSDRNHLQYAAFADPVAFGEGTKGNILMKNSGGGCNLRESQPPLFG